MRYPSAAFGVFVLFVAASFPLSAQYPPGGYPPGGYPPGGYPGGGGGGIPFPRRNKKSKTTKPQDQQPLQSITGIFRQLDEKFVIVEAKDTRIINLKRQASTKFLKNGEEIKPDVLKPGDHLYIDARQDDQGYFYAVNVSLEQEGTAEERERASVPVEIIDTQPANTNDNDRPVQRRKDSPPAPDAGQAAGPPKPAPQPPAAPASPAPAAAPQLPPPVAPDAGLDLDHIPVSTSTHQRVDDSDAGPPKLKRGKYTPKKASGTEQVATNTPPRVAPAPESAPPTSTAAPSRTDPPREALTPVADTAPPEDARIEKARAAAADFTESLPDYICQEQMARFVSTTHVVSWQPIDIVSSEVVYEKGRERYRNLQINGKAVKAKKMEELPGAWSTGEFGTVLVDIFSPSTAAEFRYRRESRSGGRDALVYDFDVDHEHSHWHIQAPSQAVLPAYKGSMWIDKETGRVLRIEMQARHLPEEFPYDKVESATEYEFIRIAERQFLLPVHAETLSCERGTSVCGHNVIDFRNYHKYTGEATITFGK
jgi:hypothetical protein